MQRPQPQSVCKEKGRWLACPPEKRSSKFWRALDGLIDLAWERSLWQWLDRRPWLVITSLLVCWKRFKLSFKALKVRIGWQTSFLTHNMEVCSSLLLLVKFSNDDNCSLCISHSLYMNTQGKFKHVLVIYPFRNSSLLTTRLHKAVWSP